MQIARYSSRDFYHTLVAIEAKVLALACRGKHEDGLQSWTDLMEFVQNEREGCAIRAAKSQAETQRKNRWAEEARKRDL